MRQEVQTNKNWFIGYGVAFLFGIIWAVVGDSDVKLLYIFIAFVLFLRSGILLEQSMIEQESHGGH